MQKILVVDDDPTIRSLIIRAVGDHFQILEAENGQRGLELARTVLPDVIVLDVRMPKVNGYDVCKALRAEDRTREIPILFLTTLGEPADQLHGLKCGADEYLVKPFDPAVLSAAITALLGKRTQRQ